MRALTFDELHSVAGGLSDDDTTVVTVVGHKPQTPYAEHVVIQPTINNPNNGATVLPIGWKDKALQAGIDYLVNLFSSLTADALASAIGSKTEQEKRDATTDFDANGKVERDYMDKDGKMHEGYYDPATDSYWIDANHNGIFETNTKVIGGNVWMDTNMDGKFDKVIWNNAVGTSPKT